MIFPCRAVAAARKAFDEGPWPRTSGRQRSRILHKFADLVEKHAEDLAKVESLVSFLWCEMNLHWWGWCVTVSLRDECP